jgi:hypothetical protein
MDSCFVMCVIAAFAGLALVWGKRRRRQSRLDRRLDELKDCD